MSATFLMSSSWITRCFSRSTLFARNWIGICPVTLCTAAIQSWSSPSVSLRVTSHTARMPCAPWKYASFNSSRKPFSPMMSQIVMSTAMSPSPFGLATTSSFFETFAPSVEMYRSSNWSWMNRRMSAVFPTAPSPTKHTLTFMRCKSAMDAASYWLYFSVTAASYKEVSGSLFPMISRGGRRVEDVGHLLREPPKRLLDVESRLRAREEIRGAFRFRDRRQVRLLHDALRAEVRLVPEDDERDLARVRPDQVNPTVQVLERVLAGEIAHRQDAMRPL